jgi:hypothetical protein
VRSVAFEAVGESCGHQRTGEERNERSRGHTQGRSAEGRGHDGHLPVAPGEPDGTQAREVIGVDPDLSRERLSRGEQGSQRRGEREGEECGAFGVKPADRLGTEAAAVEEAIGEQSRSVVFRGHHRHQHLRVVAATFWRQRLEIGVEPPRAEGWRHQ